jgi:hypothetical protein
MASLITPRMRFLHVPKTGGSWATAAMHSAGVPAVRPAELPFHADLAESRDYADRFTFAFVRHPLDFWRSYWAYRMRDGWDQTSHVDAPAASPDFDEFINRVIASVPGEAGALYERFAGPAAGAIDFVGRYEHLADDLSAALRLAGEAFDERAVRATPPVNASDYTHLSALYKRDTAERLAESERAAIERFYPWDPIPLRLLDDRDGMPIEPTSLRERLEESELELRNARAALVVLRREAVHDQALIAGQETRLADAHDALASLRASRLLHYSRPLRVRWYRVRARSGGEQRSTNH